MAALVALLVVATISVLIVRIGAIALSMTGVSQDVAALQAQSAFTGAGFTTAESEMVVTHSVRRRIIRALMLLGNVGFTSVVATVILSFLTAERTTDMLLRMGLILAGLAALWKLSTTRAFNEWLNRIIRRALEHASGFKPADYARLLHIRRGYTIAEIRIEPGEWLDGKTLAESRLRDEGVTVLGIERPDGSFLGVPEPDANMEQGDCLTVYGPEPALRRLADRESTHHGAEEHHRAVQEAESRKRREMKADAARQRSESAPRGSAPNDDQ